MQKLIDTLKSFRIEIPEDKQADVKKALSEYYKNAKEVAKTLSKVEGERDGWKERAETVEETLKGFDGIDPANIQTELAGWKKKAEDAEKEFNAKIYDRDFSDALKAALDDVNVSKYARYLRSYSDNTQFILITHRRGTMEEADVLYGVTMQQEGVSKLLELNVGEVEEKIGKLAQ